MHSNFDIDSFLSQSFKKATPKPSKPPTTSSSVKPPILSTTQLFPKTITSSIYTPLTMNTLKDTSTTLEQLYQPLYPNEKVFQSEFTSDKVFILDKFIKSKQHNKPKRISKQNYSKHLIKQLKTQEMNYNEMLELNVLWKEYISSLMNGSVNAETISAKMLKCDLHGAIIEVVSSVNKNNIGIKGILIFESRKTFNILTTSNKIKTILKQGSIFKVDLPYGDMHINILGDNFIYKSAERTKVKYKTKYNLNLKLFNE
jgi:RNase P/RNase MRP subunit p29